MTDPAPDPRPAAAGDDPAARLRSLQRRLRREKRALERLNPLEDPARYETLFTRVIDLEAQRRDLREAVGHAGDDPDDPDGD